MEEVSKLRTALHRCQWHLDQMAEFQRELLAMDAWFESHNPNQTLGLETVVVKVNLEQSLIHNPEISARLIVNSVLPDIGERIRKQIEYRRGVKDAQ